MRVRLRKIISIIIAIALLSLPVYALGNAPPKCEFDGYIVKFKDDFTLPAPMSEGESLFCPLEASDNTYTAAAISEVQPYIDYGVVDYVEPNYYMDLFEAPNDPGYTGAKQRYLDSLRLPYAWTKNIQTKNVRVCIIDSGVNKNHVDFAGLDLTKGENFLDNSKNFEDDIGHGTFITSVIAAATNNKIGMAGIAPGVEIVTMKCFSAGNKGTYADIIEAINLAVLPPEKGGFGCNIINMSFGSPQSSTALETAIKKAYDAGAILVAAVGNDYSAALRYPAAYAEVIGVGAVTNTMEKADFSNFNASVKVVAPGVNIIGASNTSNDGYKSDRGTSYSVPIVVGIAALAKSVKPQLTPQEFMDLLEETSTDLGAPGRDDSFGNGFLNAELILRCLGEDFGVFAEEANNKINIYGCISTQTFGEACSVLTASYDADGRMGDVGIIKGKTKPDGRLILPVQATGIAASRKVSIYVLNSNSAPMFNKTTYLPGKTVPN
ncbi:MAG: S8 family serine peptidase [Oscillospiraceae bacterium]